ncbi:DedA family protein [Enterobacter roggenkampii]
MAHILQALLAQDLGTLNQPGVLWGTWGLLFAVIFLESTLLPAAFLPGDSLLLLAGALSACGVLPFLPTMGLLIVATGGGYWLSYLQGRWLGHTVWFRRQLARVPERHHHRALHLTECYGPQALLIGRFIGFVRTLLPLLAGVSDFRSGRFQFFSWLGALLWVCTLMMAGSILTAFPFFQKNDVGGMKLLLILPVFLLVAGIVGSLVIFWRRER